MAKFTTDLDRTTNVAGVGSVTQPTSAIKRFKLYEAFVGLNLDVPTDDIREWQLVRLTAVATGSAVTPSKVDPADGAATILALDVLSAEGTVSDIVSTRSVHERASYTWVFYPGTEIVVPNTNNAGLKIRESAASATIAKANLNFEE